MWKLVWLVLAALVGSQAATATPSPVVATIGGLVRANVSVAMIEKWAIQVCETRHIDCGSDWACKELCEGIVGEFGPEVIEIFTKSILAPGQLCFALGLCPKPTPQPPQPPFVPVPSNCSDHSGERAWPSWSLTTGAGVFLQLSDIHTDYLYTPGSNAACPQPVCCRAEDGAGNSSWNTAGEWGHYLCDTSPKLVQSLMDHLATLNPVPDFIIYTGDDPAHDVWMQSREHNLGAIANVTRQLQQAFPKTPIFPAIGNHESFPVDQFEGPPFDSWLYDTLAQLWSQWLPDDALKTLRYAGYYTARARPGLRVMSLNTNYYSDHNFWLQINNTDFSSQLFWLNDTLKQAKQLGEKVILIGHSPPQQWLDEYACSFGHIVELFADSIVAQFFGHIHASTAHVYRDNRTDSVPLNVAYVGGSVNTYQYLNPGYRSFGYTRDRLSPYLVTSYELHWADLAVANSNHSSAGPQDWGIVRFNPLEAYGMADLSPASWQLLANKLLVDQQLVARYASHYYRGGKPYRSQSALGLSCEITSNSPGQWNHCVKKAAQMGLPTPEMSHDC